MPMKLESRYLDCYNLNGLLTTPQIQAIAEHSDVSRLAMPAAVTNPYAALTHTFPRKYSIVFFNPSASGTCGSHFNKVRARVMSGRRCFGSSCGSGLYTILLLDSV